MSFPTTEIAFLPFPPNSRLEDATSHEGSTYQSVVATAISLKGFSRSYAGRQIEHPDTVQMLVDWDALDSHLTFAQNLDFIPFSTRVQATLVDKKGLMYHAQFSPFPPSAPLEAPVTAIATFYGFPSDEKTEANRAFREDYEGWECLVKEAPGHVATAAGFRLEEVDGLAGEKMEKGKAFVVVVGWDSVDSDTAFRRMEAAKMAFEKLVLRAKEVEMHHVEFKVMDR